MTFIEIDFFKKYLLGTVSDCQTVWIHLTKTKLFHFHMIFNKKRYDSELPYQRPDLIVVMEIEIDLTTSTNVHIGFYISVRECLD